MNLIAIDPGTTRSAYVEMAPGGEIKRWGIDENDAVKYILNHGAFGIHYLAVEMVASYGKPVGKEVFQTCLWIGRFVEAHGRKPFTLIERPDVKLHLCHSRSKVTDGVIRQRIIDIYGGKEAAIGKKARPGPLYGIKADVWQALALAITWRDTVGKSEDWELR